jgi:hypothetical protein
MADNRSCAVADDSKLKLRYHLSRRCLPERHLRVRDFINYPHRYCRRRIVSSVSCKHIYGPLSSCVTRYSSLRPSRRQDPRLGWSVKNLTSRRVVARTCGIGCSHKRSWLSVELRCYGFRGTNNCISQVKCAWANQCCGLFSTKETFVEKDLELLNDFLLWVEVEMTSLNPSRGGQIACSGNTHLIGSNREAKHGCVRCSKYISRLSSWPSIILSVLPKYLVSDVTVSVDSNTASVSKSYHSCSSAWAIFVVDGRLGGCTCKCIWHAGVF